MRDADRRLVVELVLGTLRWLRRIDAILEEASGKPVVKIDANALPHLRLAVYQLLFLDRIPAYAAVHSAVAATRDRSRRAAGFVNAVLRKVAARRRVEDWPLPAEDPRTRLAIETSYPDLLAGRLIEQFGLDAARAVLEAGNLRRRNQLLCLGPREAIAAELAASGVPVEPAALTPTGLTVVRGSVPATEAFRAGRVYIQDAASQAAALVPWPTPGERILDVAAAPGGKSFALAAAEPLVRLTACDRSMARLARLDANRRRLGLDVRCFAGDAAELGCLAGQASFDRVVADLPCSGSGTIARHPELKWRISADELRRLASAGLALLGAAARQVRPGGRLCALTCSILAAENEEVVQAFLTNRNDFALEPLEDLPEPFRHGVAGPGLWRVLPSADHDGFTVHVLRRQQAP